jgi:hypothetical protein
MTVIGETGFESKVTFKNQVYFNKDTAGTAIILAGATTTEVIFEQPYENTPKITVTPSSLVNINFAVLEKSKSGFLIGISKVLEKDLEFDWIAIAITDNTAVTASDNSDTDKNDSSSGQPPIIENLTADPLGVAPGDYVSLHAYVSDLDSKDLIYEWQAVVVSPPKKGKADMGLFEGHSGLVHWQAPDVNQITEVEITVTVSDGAHLVAKSVLVTVYPTSSSSASSQESTTESLTTINSEPLLEDEVSPPSESSNPNDLAITEDSASEPAIVSEENEDNDNDNDNDNELTNSESIIEDEGPDLNIDHPEVDKGIETSELLTTNNEQTTNNNLTEEDGASTALTEDAANENLTEESTEAETNMTEATDLVEEPVVSEANGVGGPDEVNE